MKEKRLTFKRVLSQLLALVMVFSMLPELHLHAHATTVTPVTGVSVTDSANTLSGNATEMTATAKGGVFSKATNTITITNTSGAKAEISVGYSVTSANSFTIDSTSADASGTITKQLDAGGTIVFYIQSKSGISDLTVTLTLSNLTIKEVAASSTVTFQYDSSLGSVTVAGTAVASGGTADIESSGAALVATANSGVSFLGWTDGDGKILSTSATYTLTPASDMTVKAAFAKNGGTPWFGVGASAQKSVSSGLLGMGKLYYYTVGTSYLFDDLNTAATYAAEHSTKVVVLMNSGTLSAGTYTIPSGVTLLIPFDSANTMYTTEVQNMGSYTKPTAFRTLTMADGANLVVNGAVSLSAKQTYSSGAPDLTPYGSAPTGPVSFIRMNGNSNITVNNGGTLYAYGFITGSGTVTANSGASVYEMFQFSDFRGGTQSTDMQNGVFPLSQYYVQNIEVPMTLYSGATEYAYTTIYMSRADFPSSVAFIATQDAMFNLTSGYVVKKYDGSRDRLIVELHGDMAMSPVNMDVGTSSINSEEYDLGINGNITLTIADGSTATISQDLALLPGSEITVEAGATCTLNSGISVYIYDADQWGTYCAASNQKLIPVAYAPGRTYTRTAADLVDAKIIVNGTMDASAGYVYTTESGANIISDGGGVVKVNPGTQTVTYQLVQNTGYDEIPITSAKLMHADGTYLETAGKGQKAYTYENGRWICKTDVNVHVYDDGVVTTAATCTATGVKTYTCTICGGTKTEAIEATGHTFGTTTAAKAATCLADGNEAHKQCTVCNLYFAADAAVDSTDGKSDATSFVIAQKAHSYTGAIKSDGNGKDATHSFLCVNGCNQYGGAVAHTWNAGEETTAPGCESEGVKTYTCTASGCGATYTESIDATGHSWTLNKYEWSDDGKSCIAHGKCACGATTTVTGTISSKVSVAATCTENGWTTYTAVFANTSWASTQQKDVQDIPATGHKDDDHNHVCDLSGCSEIIGTCEDTDKDHICDADSACTVYSTGDNAHKDSATDKDHVCDYCGGEIENGETCSDVTTDQDHNCDVCGKVLTTEHTWTLDKYEWSADGKTCTAHGKCDCGATTTVNGSISSQVKTPATCTEKGWTTYTANFAEDWIVNKTQTKDVQDIAATGHTFGETVAAKDATCLATGNSAYKKCTACNLYFAADAATTATDGKADTTTFVIAQLAHSYTGEIKSNGNDKNATHSFKCVNGCEEYGGAVKHTWNAGEETTAPGCESAGVKTYTCTVDGCGATYTESIAATGHSYSAVVTAPTCTEQGYTTYTCSECGGAYVTDYVAATGHKDENSDHVCDNGCDVYQGTHADTNKDHVCDYGCKEAIGTCEDSDKDHKCDHGCTKYHGTHADTNKDHVCDYGCSVAIGTCEDADKDHKCDHGCDQVYGEHVDENTDHACDYGCSVAIGTCADGDKDHKCDHGCDKVYGTHEDTDKDHACDYGCKEAIGICEDSNKDHKCDYGCAKGYGTHADSKTDEDHVCDYGCGAVLETCSDKTGDKDHDCDVCGKENVTVHDYSDATCEVPSTCSECGATTGKALGHIDENTDHICDRNCGKKDMGTHEDAGKDHKCDYGCLVAIGDCADTNKDHACDYGAESETGCRAKFGEHKDEDPKDHKCDYGCSVEDFAEHKDGDNDHDCDYCGVVDFGTCADAKDDGDHVCDYGCGKTLSTCGDEGKDHTCDTDSKCTVYSTGNNACADKDGDGDHVCDYGCSKTLTTCGDEGKDHTCDTDSKCTVYSTGDNACADKDNDGDHVCDYGCGKTLTNCGDSAPKDHVCDTDSACDEYSTGNNVCADKDGDGDHVCDYGCGKTWSTCKDADNDKDHKCDECGADNVTEHIYTSVVTEPTCTAGGYTTHTCSECGDTYTDAATAAKGHSYESVVTAPTCTVDGYTTHTCSVCKDTYTDTPVSATGHTYGEITFTWTAENTQCTASHVCHCGYSETETADSTSAITTEATCTTAQVTTYTAVFEAEWISEKTQTKDVVGEKAPDNHTEKCTYTANEDGTTHTKTYPCCDTKLTEGHTYNEGVCACDKVQTFTITWVNGNTTTTTTVEYGKVPEAPGTDKTGELTKSPDINYHYSFAGWGDVVAAVGNATYTAVYSETGHDYSKNCVQCSACGYNGDSSRDHDAGNPTCEHDAVCEVCGTVVMEALGHKYTHSATESKWQYEDGEWVYYYVATCTTEANCEHKTYTETVSAQQQQEPDAEYVAPTCTTAGKATFIASGFEAAWEADKQFSAVLEIPALGHSLTETAAQDATCTAEGTRGYWTCDRCDGVFADEAATVPTTAEARKLAALGHDEKEEITKPNTCTEDGLKTLTCQREGCGNTRTEVIPAAHSWTHAGETPATCTQAGETSGSVCSVCGVEQDRETIPALGHTYGEAEYAWDDNNNCTATRACKRDGCTEAEEGHTETAKATVSSKITTESTCTVKGSTTYTAKFDVTWATEQVQTLQDVELAVHTPDAGVITKSPFYNKAGERTFHCTKCGRVTGTVVEPATGVINISVLGDSITAFTDYSNGKAAVDANSTLDGGSVWFPMTNRLYDSEGNPISGEGEITEAEHIWIYQAAEKLGANILVNNSWSGSAVHFWQYGAPGMYEDRVVQLHDNTGDNSGQEPDIIVVYMGTNDFKYTELVNGTYAKIENGSYYQSVLGSYGDVDFDALINANDDGTFTYGKPENAMEAYAISFHKMKNRYPDSEIYVMTLLPFRVGKSQPTEFNDDLKEMANHFGLNVVDIYDTGIESDRTNFKYLMEDWLHPNLKGMEVLANAFESAVRNNSALYLGDFVNVSCDIGDGVTAMEGTTRTAMVGEDFFASLKLNDQSLIMQVRVYRNGEDITNTCMEEVDDPNTKLGGKIVNIHIDDVAKGDVIEIQANAHKHEYTGVVTAPTCTEAGFTTYTCECGDSYVANEVAALGHNYTQLSDEVATEATCTENAKYYAKCELCGDVHTTETFEAENTKLGHSYNTKASEQEASAATCTESARYYVQCDRCDAVSTEMTVSVGDALGHNYADATYDWTYDATNSTWICTAKRVCCTDSSHVETAKATVTSEEKQAATCTEKGWTTYTATFDVDWAAKQTQDVEDIAALGHAYGVTTYEWTNDNKNCTAKRVCARDAKHVETVEATVTSVEKTPATCTAKGWTTYTANFVVGWATTQATEAEDISAKGHTEVVDAAVAATCTATGLTEGSHCSVCREVLVAQTEVEALGHNMTRHDAAEPTCTATGNTEYYTCDRCNKVFKDEAGVTETTVADETIAALGHNMTKTEAKDATCTATGNNEYHTCGRCNKEFKDEAGVTETTVAKETINVLGHDLATVAAKAATCTDIGWNAYEYCKREGCGHTTYSELAALGHSMTKTEAKAATCTATGNNAYHTCNTCNKVFKDEAGVTGTTVAAETIAAIGHSYDEGKVTTAPTCTGKGVKTFTCQNDHSHTYTESMDALGHDPEYVKAKAPTCIEAGYEAHYKCSRENCGVLFLDEAGTTTTTEAALVVNAKGHTEVVDAAVAATCTKKGLTAGKHCSVCDENLVAQTVVDALGHTEVTDEAVAPTCTATGRTEGLHCSVCDEVLVAQTEVEALGHTEVTDEAVAPTCTATGLTEGSHCSVCDEVLVAQETVEVLAHTEVVDEAVDPTCTATGLTEGSHCSVCNTVLVAQQTVTQLGHSYSAAVTSPTCTEGGYTTYTCSRCDNSYTANETSATGHSFSAVWTTDETNHWHECACGEKSDVSAHSDVTTDKDHNCDVCGYVMSECADSDDADHKCDHCGKDGITDHVFGTEWKSDGTNHWHECACGEKSDKSVHTDGDDKNHDCDNCGATDIEGHTASEAVVENKIDATCGKAGSYNSVVYCSECGEKLSTTTETIPATGDHADGDDTDHDCDNCDATDIEGHTAGEAVVEDQIDATCGKAGSYNSIVYCSECGEKLSTTTVTIPATGNHADGDDTDHNCDTCGKEIASCHSYTLDATKGENGYKWSDDGKTCTAYGMCSCGATTAVNGTITSAAKTPATCAEMGWTTYTATFEGVTGATAQTKDVQDIPVADHAWGEPTYTDNEDGTHTASYICSVDATHTKTDDPVEHTYVDGFCACGAEGELIVYVASVNGTMYETLAEAVAAANSGDTVTLLSDAAGAGVVIDKSITIDFGGYTYTVNSAVGSSGDETLGLQILAGNTVTLKNGTLTANDELTAQVLVMNSANLNVVDMTLTGNENTLYALSNNSGTVNITGATNMDAKNGVAIGVCQHEGYEAPVVNVDTTGMIKGKIEVSEEISTNLNISGGTFTVEIAPDWCAEGYEPKDNGDGTYGVTKKSGEDHTHIPGEAVVENKIEATCSKDGSYNSVVYCTDCGEKLSGTYKVIPATGNHIDGDDQDHDCDTCGKENISSHDYVKVLDRKEATCTEDGYELRACVCGDEYREVMAALGHKDNDGDHYCDGCGKSMLRGDLDLDGDVDSDDLTLLARHVGGIELLTGLALHNADVDLDGDVDADDLTLHARYVGGIILDWSEGLGTAEE